MEGLTACICGCGACFKTLCSVVWVLLLVNSNKARTALSMIPGIAITKHLEASFLRELSRERVLYDVVSISKASFLLGQQSFLTCFTYKLAC